MLVFRRILLIPLRNDLALYQMIIIAVVTVLSAIIHQKLIYFVIQEPVKNIELSLLLAMFLRMLFI